MNEWSRADLPEVRTLWAKMQWRRWSPDLAASIVDAVVDHLNREHPKPESVRMGTAANNMLRETLANVERDRDRWRRAHEIVEGERDLARDRWREAERERDKASTRAGAHAAGATRANVDRDKAYSELTAVSNRLAAAERERDVWKTRAEVAEKRHKWPKVTPTGHTYVKPGTYGALCHEHDNAAQAAVESWDADECPPEPTWEMVGIAHREVERLQRERDSWKARAEQAEQARDTAAVRARQDEAVLKRRQADMDDLALAMVKGNAAYTAPPVTRDQLWRVLAAHDPGDDELGVSRVGAVTDAVWALVQGDDPAVFIVRESELPDPLDARNFDLGDRQTKFRSATDDEVADAFEGVKSDLRYVLAVRRAIGAESEQVDPVEVKAEELAKVMWEGRPLGGLVGEEQERIRRVAAHVLGREASDA